MVLTISLHSQPSGFMMRGGRARRKTDFEYPSSRQKNNCLLGTGCEVWIIVMFISEKTYFDFYKSW